MKPFLTKSAAILFLLISCAPATRVPITKRKQRLVYSDTEMNTLSLTNYSEFLVANPALPASDAQVKLVRKVGDKIKKSVEDFMAKEGLSDQIKDFKWEFNVVDAPDVNAWCMPGGKVVVYTGLLPVTKTEEGLAVVMGHEIAHAIARHGNERMSKAYKSEMLGNTLGAVVGIGSPKASEVFKTSYGVGAALTLLKYSRVHETEADKLGVIFMAMSGYDPEKSIEFWERMAGNGGGGSLQMLSTHPSDETRVSDLKKFMPTAKTYYKPN